MIESYEKPLSQRSRKKMADYYISVLGFVVNCGKSQYILLSILRNRDFRLIRIAAKYHTIEDSWYHYFPALAP
jgi:hypothetical protein